MTSSCPVLLGQFGLSKGEWCVEIFVSLCLVAIPAVVLFALFDQVRIARRGRTAGTLLFRARPPRSEMAESVFYILVAIIFPVGIVWVGRRAANAFSGLSLPTVVSEVIFLPLFVLLVTCTVHAVYSTQFSIRGLELRERGLHLDRHFVPWDQIACGRWLRKNRLLRLEFASYYRLAAIRKDDVARTDALLREHIEVRDESDAGKDASSRRRKLRLISLQFRLRTLLVAFVVVALVLGIFMMRRERIRKNWEIGARFEESGAYVGYFWGRVWDLDLSTRPPHTRFPTGRPITEDDLAAIEQLPEMSSLTLDGTTIRDADLARLAPLRRLDSLFLRRTPITDAGLKHLARLPGLLVLEVRETRITDEALADLGGMKQLEYVGVTGTRMTPAGVARLQQALPTARIDFTPPAAPNAK